VINNSWFCGFCGFYFFILFIIIIISIELFMDPILISPPPLKGRL
jgi:hypothetical protein